MTIRGRWVTWAVLGAGLLTSGCVGVVGAGAAVVVVGAGVLSMTCYDRVSVTVTDQVTGTKLCDAKVTFIEGTSVTEANSCYQAALSTGHYKMRVERQGLVPYEEPIDIDTGKGCKHAVQTVWVALDRPNFKTQPQQIGARAAQPAAPAATNGTVTAPAPTPSVAPAATAPPVAPAAPPVALPPPPSAPSGAAGPPAAGAFPTAPAAPATP